jgi:hypothetical protein
MTTSVRRQSDASRPAAGDRVAREEVEQEYRKLLSNCNREQDEGNVRLNQN